MLSQSAKNIRGSWVLDIDPNDVLEHIDEREKALRLAVELHGVGRLAVARVWFNPRRGRDRGRAIVKTER